MTDDRLARQLRRQLDAATQLVPPQPGPETRLRSGRRALRRRRAASAVAGLAALAVVSTGAGVAWTAVDDGPTGQRGTDVAGRSDAPRASSDPCPAIATDTDPATTRIELPDDQEPFLRLSSDDERLPVDYEDGGRIYAQPGVRVVQHLEGPGNDADSGWDAVEVEGSNGRFFQLLGYSGGGSASSASGLYPVTAERDSLPAWVAYRLDVAGGAPDLVTLDDDGMMSDRGAAQVWQLQTADVPGVDAASRVSVAEVRVGDDTCFVLADVPPVGPTQLHVVPPEYAGIAADERDELDAFARTAREMLGGETS